MNRRDAKALTGLEWLQSAARTDWETRIMRRRVPIYKATIKALQLLNKLSRGPDRPSMKVTYWERMGPGGKTFWMPKLETMTGRTDDPVTSPKQLRARTTFASRLARVISADEWPQIIQEYERRQRGEPPRFHYIGHRPLNRNSHAMMDRAWAMGELPTEEYRIWNAEVKFKENPAIYSEFYTHGGSRTFPGGENNPAYRLSRLLHDVRWRGKASKANEIRVLRKARVLRAQQLVKFVGAEIRRSGSHQPSAAAPDVYTPEVVAAVSDFTKPPILRSPTARGETTPDPVRANANDLANTVARALPPPTVKREPSAAHPPAARPPTPPGHSPRHDRSR